MTSTYNGNGYSGGGSTGWAGYQTPKLAFWDKNADIEYWGSARDKLDNFAFKPNDLIICLTGTKVHPSSFMKEGPDWIAEMCKPSSIQQIVIDWKDMNPPPENIELDFWKTIADRAQENGVKRIIVCCQGGKGRTGTALASFYMATRDDDPEPYEAIDIIRDDYSESAIETEGQMKYLLRLVYDWKMVESIMDEWKEEEKREKEAKKKEEESTKNDDPYDIENYDGELDLLSMHYNGKKL